jgi:hypothetical protein
MAINLTAAFKRALDILFSVASELVRGATYYRPASFSSSTGQTTSAEQMATVNALVASYRPRELGAVVIQPGDEKVLVRALDLAAIPSPAVGDYMVEASTGQRRDVLSARMDPTGQLWTFQTVRSANEDWGDLIAATVSADWGDLTAATDFEDWMGLT